MSVLRTDERVKLELGVGGSQGHCREVGGWGCCRQGSDVCGCGCERECDGLTRRGETSGGWTHRKELGKRLMGPPFPPDPSPPHG